MTAAEKIIRIMRKQGAYYNSKGIRIAEVVKSGNVKIGELTIEPEDYVCNADIKIKEGDEVAIYKISEELYLILCKVV